MPLLIAGAVIAGGSAIAQGVTGAKQMKDAREAQENLVKPEYQIPQEIFDNMTLAERRMYEGLPDIQKQEFLNNIQNQTRQALSSASTRKAGLGLVSDLYAQEQSGLQQLMIADVKAREANIEKAMAARKEVAQAKLQKFEHDYSDYSAQLDYHRSAESAGMQNIFGALDTLGSTAVTLGAGGLGGGGGTNVAKPTTQTVGETSSFGFPTDFSAEAIMGRTGMSLSPLK